MLRRLVAARVLHQARSSHLSPLACLVSRCVLAGVTAIARGCPRLQQLDLCGGHFVTDGAMAAVASGCPDLRSLNLTWCDSVPSQCLFPSIALLSGRGGAAFGLVAFV